LFEEKFKNFARALLFGLSAYMLMRVDCKQANQGGKLMVLQSSLFSQGNYLVVTSRLGVEFGRKNE